MFFQRWIDEYLRWNATDFGGVQQIWIPAPQIWTPDIFINNLWVPSIHLAPAPAADISETWCSAVADAEWWWGCGRAIAITLKWRRRLAGEIYIFIYNLYLVRSSVAVDPWHAVQRNGWMDGRRDGWREGRRDRHTDRQTGQYLLSLTNCYRKTERDRKRDLEL